MAVKVTDWPKVDGLRLLEIVVVVVTPFTIWLSALEVLPAYVASPP